MVVLRYLDSKPSAPIETDHHRIVDRERRGSNVYKQLIGALFVFPRFSQNEPSKEEEQI